MPAFGRASGGLDELRAAGVSSTDFSDVVVLLLLKNELGAALSTFETCKKPFRKNS